MAVSSTGNSSLDRIAASYQSNEDEKAKKQDALGRDTFLTMLVAQLQNQDPLNPMEGTDFSSQLAQFSQLEQLINLNDSMAQMASALSQSSEKDALGLVGKQVTANVDVMNVADGTVSGGFFNLAKPADIVITITDADGNTVKTLHKGQHGVGSHLISWDGTDNAGKAVPDGTYKYTVLADTGSGFSQVPATLTGTVEGVAYNNGKAYLVIQGILVDPASITAVTDPSDQNPDDPMAAMEYLGKKITSNAPIVLVEDGDVSGSDLSFELDAEDAKEEVTVNIYDAYDKLVRTITIDADDLQEGSNTVEWDGLSSDDGDGEYPVADGLYYYTVKTKSGYADTPVAEEVSGIKKINNTQFLVLKDSGRLVALSKVTGVELLE